MYLSCNNDRPAWQPPIWWPHRFWSRCRTRREKWAEKGWLFLSHTMPLKGHLSQFLRLRECSENSPTLQSQYEINIYIDWLQPTRFWGYFHFRTFTFEGLMTQYINITITVVTWCIFIPIMAIYSSCAVFYCFSSPHRYPI